MVLQTMALRQCLRNSSRSATLLQLQQQQKQQGLRFFSAEPAAAAATAVATNNDASSSTAMDNEWVPPPHPTSFRSAKVEEAYFGLIALSKEEIGQVARLALLRVDIDIDAQRAKRKAMFEAGGGAAAMLAGGANDNEAAEAAAAPAKTAFDVKLLGFDAKAKIKVIKEIRAITGLGLKEAKELVEGAPKVIKKNVKQEEADALQAKLIEVGAQIEIV